MNLFSQYVDHVTRSAAPRRTRRHYSRAGTVAFWLVSIALLYVGSRL